MSNEIRLHHILPYVVLEKAYLSKADSRKQDQIMEKIFDYRADILNIYRGKFGCDHIFVIPDFTLKSCSVVIIFS